MSFNLSLARVFKKTERGIFYFSASGTLRSLTLRGRLSGPDDNYASRVWLREYRGGGDYLDNDHLKTYDISNNAPFTGEEAEVKFNNLTIPLDPTRYYRLTTYYDYQNRNVILKGTNATGTSSWWSLDTCTTCGLPAWNRTRHDYAFFPFIVMGGSWRLDRHGFAETKRLLSLNA